MSHPTVIPLTRFRADLSRALARRGKNLLTADDLPQQVAGLEPLEAYFIIKELGVDSAIPIIQQATGDQLRCCIDLDCWDGEIPSLEDLDAWLAPFAAEGPDALVDIFLTLEEELQVLFLAGSLDIYDANLDQPPPERTDRPRTKTPDDFFVLDRATEGEREVEPFVLVAALYRRSIEEAFRLLTAAKWELVSDLQETGYRFRNGRLQDLGFPPVEQARSLLSAPPRPPSQAAAQAKRRPTDSPVTRLPALYAAPLTDTCLLHRAMARLTDPEELAAIEQELVWVVNAALVAYGKSPRDISYVKGLAAEVRDTISLGLEVLLQPQDRGADSLADHDAEASELVRFWPLRDLFRHGYAKISALAAKARNAVTDPAVAAWLSRPTIDRSDDWHQRADYAFIEALLGPRPLHGATRADALEHTQAFASLAELADAEHKLDDLVARHRGLAAR